MKLQTAFGVLMIGLMSFGCKPGLGSSNDYRGTANPFVDGTKGEKPIPCNFGACGSWRSPDQNVGRNLVQVSISFAANQFTRKVTCHYGDDTSRVAQVTVKAQVTASEIHILQNEVARDLGPNGQPSCESRVDQTRVKYSVQNKKTLLIQYNNGQTATWERE